MTDEEPLGSDRTALVLIDLQNDFIHPSGAYSRGNCIAPTMQPLAKRLQPLTKRFRDTGGCIISTHFTLIGGRDGEPLISPHLRALRPFLRAGDFSSGSWGHALVDELQPAHFSVEKIAYSAFYMSRLEWVLRKAGVDTLVFAGITSNGGVSSTVRDAHVREFNCLVLEDGCASFDERAHRTAMEALGGVAEVVTCQNLTHRLEDR